MKHCPKCKREYEDDSLRFCLEDGTALAGEEVRPTVASPTMVLPVEQQSGPTISKVGRPDVPLMGKIDARTRVTQPDDSKPSGSPATTQVIVVVLFVLALIVNVVGLIVWTFIFVRRLPLTLLFLGVMLFAIVRARRHPKASLLAGLAIGFDIIESFLYFAVNRAAPANFYQVLAVLDDFALGGVMILLTAAVLTQRTSQAAIN